MKLQKRLLALLLVIALVAAFTVNIVSAKESEPTIVDIALAVNADSGEFSTLIAALVAADLVGVLDGNRQFTVFAPTDEAFAKLGLNAGNIGTALDKATLTSILLYHVAPGERFSGDVVSSDRIRTVSKGFLFPSVTEEGAFVNSSKIVAVDIDASNGVIHIIDTVLLP